MKSISLSLVAVACVTLFASGAMGGSVFFSQATDVGQGAAPTADVGVFPGTTLTLGIWATDDQDYDTTIGMNIVSSDPSAVALGGAEVANPEIFSNALGAPVGTRWQDVSVGEVTAGQVSNMNAARVTSGTGILGANDGTAAPFQNQDTLYDVDAGAFLLGWVHMTKSSVFGDNSDLSINQEGTALFVNSGQQVFPDFLPVNLVDYEVYKGDLNDDGLVNGLDVDPFVDVLLNGSELWQADMNDDGVVNGLDVDPFVAAVVGGGTQQIPEPSTLLLCIIAMSGVSAAGRRASRSLPYKRGTS